MRKRLRKIILFILVVFLTGSLPKTVIVHASDHNRFNYVLSIDDSIYYCLKTAKLDMSKDYYVSEKFDITNSNNNEAMSFVFCEQECVGEIIHSTNDDGYVFLRENCKELTNIYQNNKFMIWWHAFCLI